MYRQPQYGTRGKGPWGVSSKADQPPSIKRVRAFGDNEVNGSESATSALSNLLTDKHVYGSSLISRDTRPKFSQSFLSRLNHGGAEARRIKRRLQKAKEATADPFKPERLLTPAPVSGRQHIQLQTEEHLIELTQHAREFMAETQTEPWMDKPPTPMFRPHREEVHVATQILDGDLFDFEEEVVPILEVIVGKVLEQSITEVLEEEELAAIQKQQDEFDRARMLELIEVQRLEAAEKRRQEETERRLAQAQAWQEIKLTTYRKMLAMDFAAVQRRGCSQMALRELAESANLFMHPNVGAVSVLFWPSLMRQATDEVAFMKDGVSTIVSDTSMLFSLYQHNDASTEKTSIVCARGCFQTMKNKRRWLRTRRMMEKHGRQQRLRLEQIRVKNEIKATNERRWKQPIALRKCESGRQPRLPDWHRRRKRMHVGQKRRHCWKQRGTQTELQATLTSTKMKMRRNKVSGDKHETSPAVSDHEFYKHRWSPYSTFVRIADLERFTRGLPYKGTTFNLATLVRASHTRVHLRTGELEDGFVKVTNSQR
uniref:Radial spoke 3 protein n=1 Tax=Toxoplasma gondii (strain ATCC 50861 / VEG) TaxID=432359 RepID=A0A0F7UTA9_TOXGV|nr:TPA: radial spoke 3 protein [Toxoplasma gondii VEG]